MKLEQLPTGWKVDLENCTIGQFFVARELALRIDDAGVDAAWLRIEAPFALETHDGDTIQLSPAHPEGLGPVLGLFNHRLKCLDVSSYGEACLRLADSRSIRIPPLVDFEAWEFSSGERLRIVCGPTGILTTWDQKD